MLENVLSEKELGEKAIAIRKSIITMLHASGSGHPGGSLSIVEILMAIYYKTANIDPENPKMENRDRIVLSKGHAAPALYATLAELGYFPKEDLIGLRKIDSHLQGHPDMNKTPGVDMCTGSLGQGISVAVGMAMAAKYKKADSKVFAILGDGELQEGLVWEAMMAAAHYKLDNLIVIVDNNGLQIDGKNEDVMNLGSLKDKFTAFGAEVIEVDGHDLEEIAAAIKKESQAKPKVIIAKTVKGKGVSFMENNFGWHGKAPNDEETNKALKELEA